MSGIFGSATLDTAIGLVFVYLLVSLIASAVNEWIAQFAQLRATTLEDGLRQMLQDPPTGGLTDMIFAHALIAGLSPKTSSSTPAQPHARPPRPSYIGARQFALALLDVVAPHGGGTSQSVQDLRITVSTIENEAVKQALMAIINDAQNDIAAVRLGIEQWFDATMDRVSGWYKRKLRYITLAVGLTLVVVLNVDTLGLGQALWSTPVLRAAIASAASDYVKANAGTGTNFSDQAAQAEQGLESLPALNLPIFWSSQPRDPRAFPWLTGSLSAWVSKLVGLLLSVLAVSLGAPFWFDVLNRFMSFRSSGPPPPAAGSTTPE